MRVTVDRSLERLRERVGDLCTLQARLEDAGSHFVLKFNYALNSDRTPRSAVFTIPVAGQSELEQRRAMTEIIEGMEEVIVTSEWRRDWRHEA